MRSVAFLLLLLLAACSPGQPDLRVRSPDGGHTGEVRNHWSIDPPDQSLWLDDMKIAKLGEDMDWCNRIVWSADSSTVAYLVQDAKLIVVDAATKRIVTERWLVDRDGYPTTRKAVDLRLSDRGNIAVFKRCSRKARACSGDIFCRSASAVTLCRLPARLHGRMFVVSVR